MSTNRLKEKYEKTVKGELAKEFGIKNPHSLPVITKVVINTGLGDLSKNKEALSNLTSDLASIAGQKPAARAAKVSVASFNVRAGQVVGLTATLRGKRMYDFLDRLITIVFPRLRDFKGIPNRGFDTAGNYTLGLTEYSVFPEIDITKVANPRGLEITLVIANGSPEKSKKLLQLLGVPFEK